MSKQISNQVYENIDDLSVQIECAVDELLIIRQAVEDGCFAQSVIINALYSVSLRLTDIYDFMNTLALNVRGKMVET